MTPSKGIAIVGIGCRLPGGIRSPRQFASFLREHGDAVVDVPADRWNADLHYDPDPQAPGKAYVRRAAFLQDDVFSFDPDPFGISSKEADQLDPQQRLLLEVSWEAFEDAGIPIDRLRGSNTAVYVGGFTLDHQAIAYLPQNRRLISSHTSVGASMTLLSNRISYTFDLRGPSMTVDTACSSSLVATHLGVESIVRGDCDLAVVGGVNVILSPTVMVAMCKGQFLAADGRSKTFDATADGYGRGEGAAVVVLKAYDKAMADGDRVYAVILATGLNQDGRTPGIAMPSEQAQRSLGERVLCASGLRSADIGYVEAHGTGTRAGDPIEVRALAGVYGRDREAPLVIGSVKSNIGHLEAAAGVTGLIKAALSVHGREIFPVRSVGELNPDIPFQELNVQVARDARPWPTDRPARIAVNSFGYGGTNAHAIVSEPPPRAEPDPRAPHEPARRPWVVPFSAASPDALIAHATQLAEAIDDANWEDQALTLARGRAHLPERAALLASSAVELRDQLRKAASGDWGDDRIAGHAGADRKLLWVFTGMGPQWWAMGHELHRSEPVFRDAAEEADRAFRAVAGWSALSEMLREEPSSRMASNAVAQPANFILQVGLVALLRDLGVPEDGLLGHSVGEVAAAWAAGSLSIEDAAFVACHRSRLQQTLAGQGTMLAVGLSEADVGPFTDGVVGVEIAAYNAPKSVTLAGSRAGLERVAGLLTAEGIFNRFVPVEIAYHSAHMDPLEGDFLSALAPVAPRVPERPLYSTARGTLLSHADHDAGYWWENARRPVLLQIALERALADGYSAFLEVGPHPVLGPAIREIMQGAGKEPATSFCLKRGRPEVRTVLRAVGELFANGAHVDWKRLYPRGRRGEVPKYPFRRRAHWVESTASRELRLGRADGPFCDREDGPVLRLVYDLALPSVKYLQDHRIQGAAVFPGAAYIDCLLRACVESNGAKDEYVLDRVKLERALIVRAKASPCVRVDLDREEGTLSVYARHDEKTWERYARARWIADAAYRGVTRVDPEGMGVGFDEAMDVDEAYRVFGRMGLAYGPAFRGLRSLRTRRGASGCVHLLAGLAVDPGIGVPACVHPALVDAAFQALLAVIGETRAGAMVPVSADRIRWMRSGGIPAWAEGKVHPPSGGRLRASLLLRDQNGAPVLEIVGLECRSLQGDGATNASSTADLFHLDSWRDLPWPEPSDNAGRPWGLAGDATAFLDSLEETLRTRGIPTRRIESDATVLPDCSRVVFACDEHDADPVGVAACDRLRHLVLLMAPASGALRVVTFGAHGVADGDVPVPGQAALWGLARVAMTELPELACRLVDLSPAEALPSRLAPRLVDLLDIGDFDEETAVRSGALITHRIHRAAPGEMSPAPRPVPVGSYEGAFALEPGNEPGAIRFAPRPRPMPVGAEVEIAVLCASVHRCDTSDPPVGAHGREAAARPGWRSIVGTVARLGPSANRLHVGDTVVAIASSELTSHVTLDERRAVPLMAGHEAVDAVAYADFFAAWHALRNVARIEPGDSVLIHRADGPVGSACLQVARIVGARIFATVSDQDMLRDGLPGVLATYSARTLDFVDAVRTATGDHGVDVIASTVPDPARSKGVEALAVGGRFVDFGAAPSDREGGTRLPSLRRGQSVAVVDLGDLAERRPGQYEEVARAVLDAFAHGRLVLPKARAIDAGAAVATTGLAWEDSGASRSVLDLSTRTASVDASAGREIVRPDRSYLVTGGLSGFGLSTARWLVEQGARCVVLASRRGEAGPDSAAEIDRMRAAGARVECMKLDVADAASIDRAFEVIRARLPLLGGVFHSAMVLEDGPLGSVDARSLQRVMLPKALGALLLYRKTRHDRLDHFVLYSSVSAAVGNPNQGAYAAANACLEAVAAAARSEGRAATCVSWGAIDDVGVVARSGATRAHLQRLGLDPIPANVALEALGTALRSGRTSVGVIDMDWDRWRENFAKTAWSRLEEVLEESAPAGQTLERTRSEMATLDRASKVRRVRAMIRKTAAHLLGFAEDRLHDDVPLTTYGLDSLMAVDMQGALERSSGVAIPSIHFLTAVSVADLGERLIDALERPPVAPAPSPSAPEAFRAYLLSRICVHPPYFDLSDCARDGEWVTALVKPVPPTDDEEDLVSCAEAARHLAIVGSCAVSLRSTSAGRAYYPVARAHSMRMPNIPIANDHYPDDALETVRVRARCRSFDEAGSRASADTELLDLSGNVIFTLRVDYHVIQTDDFARLFASHAEPTDEATGLDPYRAHHFPAIEEGDGFVRTSIGPIRPLSCLGHFVGYPALPVSILTRHAIALVARGVRRSAGGDAKIAIAHGSVETRSLLFAHETCTLTARLSGRAADGHPLWRCDVERDGSLVAAFQFGTRVVRRPISEVRDLRRRAVMPAGRQEGDAVNATNERPLPSATRSSNRRHLGK
jgi:acyl transferase domain-containing protein/NADPH:quinone reductase-like Zn-dependent oxidoreductase/NAD(P)-dependent dehydrogenase (short-subunit alcohol dehydrogenase family)/acyl carrier protein